MQTAVGTNPALAPIASAVADVQPSPQAQAAAVEDSSTSLHSHTLYPHYDFRACGPSSAIEPTGMPGRVSPPLRPRYR